MNESPPVPDANISGPLGGRRLAVARRAHEISAGDIAKELHLDELKVRALEQNNFDLLGAPVFAKGHLRKYAELVGVPIDDILADYYELNRAAGVPPVVGPVRKVEHDFSLGLWIAGGVAGIIIAIAAYWWLSREPVLPVARTEPAILAPYSSRGTDEPAQDEATEPTGNMSDAEPLVAGQESAPQETVLASSTETAFAADTPAEVTSAPPQVQIELLFSGDCWTEVSDASGRSLFYDLGTAGRVVALSGDEPLQVVLGNSENISITVDGQDYPIADQVRRGSLTRLTISSQ